MESIYAAPKARARLISPWALGAIAVLIGITLRLLFPESNLLALLADAPRGDPLTVSYLANLHALEPADPRTAILLARSRLAQGRMAEALALASQHARSPDPELRRAAMRVRLEVLREELAGAAPGAASQASAAALGAAARASLAEPWTRDELLLLAADAEAARDRALEREIYDRIIAREHDPAWLEAAARRFLGRGEYRSASRLFFAARRNAADPARTKALFLDGVRALQSGNLPGEALAAAETEIGPLASDEAVLVELARLALAAGRPDAAARYMKQLMFRAPEASQLRGLLDAIAAWLAPPAYAAEPLEIRRPYDERLYTLAYDVFLANGDVESAYRVARAAIDSVPEDAAWRERYARVAEWSRRPAEALAAWRWLAERGGAETAWQAILRLAPGLGDDEALLPALRRQAEAQGAKASDVTALVAAWERVGRPEEALAWLEARADRGDDAALALAADLAERMGRRDHAIALNARLIEKTPPGTARLVRMATLQVLAGRYADAHALLRRFRSTAPPEAREYWDLLGDLAWMLQEDDSAIEAYRLASERKDIEAGDLDRLVSLLRERQPAEAIRLAQMGYERFHVPGLLLQALEMLWQQKDLAALKKAYAGLGAEDEKRFAQTPYFFTLRSQYRQAAGDMAGARADMDRAIAIAPDNAELRVSMLWLLIDAHDNAALRRSLENAALAPADHGAWAAQASGWIALGEAKRALPFFARLVQASPRDYLWLSAYADALEQDGQLGAADRVRRYAWAEVRRAAQKPDALKDRNLREAWVRYILARSPGDPSLAVIRDLLRADSIPGLAPADGERKAAAKELVLSWLISTEQHENAKAWLWLRYGRELAGPGWARVSIALAEGDAEAAAKLLAERPAEIPYRDRVEAARLAKQLGTAQTIAFEAQETHPDDDVLHLQLSQVLLEDAHRVTGGAAVARRGVVDSRPRELATEVWLAPRLRMAVELKEASQRSLDPAVLTGVPAHDREVLVSARRLLDDGWIDIGIGARDGFADSNSARMQIYQNWGRRVSTLFTAARNERTLDSSALAVAGMRDEISLRTLYTLSKTEYLSGQLWGARYRSQDGISLGTAKGYDAEAGHRIRIEYPDVTVRVGVARLISHTEGTGDEATAALNPAGVNPGPSFFVPAGSVRQGIGIGIGESVRDSWSRALRPYAGADLTHNTLTGAGYNLRLGVRGNVLGPDQLNLYWTRARGGGASGDSILEYGIRYEYYFDRF
ncbi:MAG TPA: tetratricopeptide repeat protein [Burkholderiales bacterium]|nr:tetratricopeptide repeat protein [Burkholderiales bacterium]